MEDNSETDPLDQEIMRNIELNNAKKDNYPAQDSIRMVIKLSQQTFTTSNNPSCLIQDRSTIFFCDIEPHWLNTIVKTGTSVPLTLILHDSV